MTSRIQCDGPGCATAIDADELTQGWFSITHLGQDWDCCSPDCAIKRIVADSKLTGCKCRFDNVRNCMTQRGCPVHETRPRVKGCPDCGSTELDDSIPPPGVYLVHLPTCVQLLPVQAT